MSTAGGKRMSAIYLLRSDHQDCNEQLGLACTPACVVCAALVDLEALVEAAQRAERKLWHEYRRDFDEQVPDSESWSEGESLAYALRRVRGDA